MNKIHKKAFVFRIGYFIIFVIVVILLFFLIRNDWDVNAAFSDMANLLRLSKSKISLAIVLSVVSFGVFGIILF